MPRIPVQAYRCMSPATVHGVREERVKRRAELWCKAIGEAITAPTNSSARRMWPLCLLGSTEEIAAEIVKLYQDAGWCALVITRDLRAIENSVIFLSELIMSDDEVRAATEGAYIKLELQDPAL